MEKLRGHIVEMEEDFIHCRIIREFKTDLMLEFPVLLLNDKQKEVKELGLVIEYDVSTREIKFMSETLKFDI